MYGGSFESRTLMLPERGATGGVMYRNFALLENHAKHRSRHYCSYVRVAIVAAPRNAPNRLDSRAKAAQLFAFSHARVREALAHLGARAAHLLPVSRPRCEDGAGDRPPERGRPLCQLRRLRERRRGRRKRRGQGGASESRTMPRAFLFSARRGPAPATASAVPPPASSR